MTDVQPRWKGSQKRQKRRNAARYNKARAEVIERSGGRCEAAVEGVCKVQGTNAHHKRMSGQGGPATPENLLWACGSGTTGCHGWIPANPREAVQLGLLVSSFAPAPGLLLLPNVKDA